jgi:hypothetical protein
VYFQKKKKDFGGKLSVNLTLCKLPSSRAEMWLTIDVTTVFISKANTFANYIAKRFTPTAKKIR